MATAGMATGLIIVTGTITFTNEWYQTKKINWRIPVATVLAALVFDGMGQLDANAATGLAAIAFLTAMTTEFNGKSVAATVSGLFPSSKKVTVVLWILSKLSCLESSLSV
jgi:hypothetical protein